MDRSGSRTPSTTWPTLLIFAIPFPAYLVAIRPRSPDSSDTAPADCAWSLVASPTPTIQVFGSPRTTKPGIRSGRPAPPPQLVRNLGLDELRQERERFLPTETARLGRDDGRQPLLHDVQLGSAGEALFKVIVVCISPG